MSTAQGRQTALDVVVRSKARIGEGPIWDARSGSLRWVDILAGHIYRTDITSGTSTRRDLPTIVGAIAPTSQGDLVVACKEGFGRLSEEGSFEVLLSFLSPVHRMNDAKCDAAGRFWAGSTAVRPTVGEGALHMLSPGWTSKVVQEDLGLPNGIAWSPGGDKMYLADSLLRLLSVFDFDQDSGTVSSRRTLLEFPSGMGTPDGLSADTAGCLWVAMWGGACVVRISPNGELDRSIPVPVRQPTSCAFGGPGMDVIFITSAREGLDLPETSLDGSVFALSGSGQRGTSQPPFATPSELSPPEVLPPP